MAIDYSIAKSYLDAGLSVLPAIKAQKRPNLNTWDCYKNQLPTDKDLHSWFDNNSSGVCIVCGAVSGNLEIIDFDEKGIAYGPWADKVKADPMVAELYPRLVVEQSPSGGYHVIYRCELPVAGNQKLAKTADAKTLIETRGEGGLFLCAPTEGYQLLQGDFQTIPKISAVERNILLQLARTFNAEKPKQAAAVGSLGLPISQPMDAPQTFRRSDAEPEPNGRPGDVFNQTGDIRALLTKHGWTFAYKSGDEERWTRPGKKTGTSATLRNVDGKEYFYVFSSNAAPLESDRSYDGFGLFAALECGGDTSLASDELAKLGFGDRFAPDPFRPQIDFSSLRINGNLPTFQTTPTKTDAKVFLNRRDPENFEDFPLDHLPPITRRYVVEKAKALNQNPAGIATALLTQAGAHIGAGCKLRLGNDRFTAPILWFVYMALSGSGKSPVLNGIKNLVQDRIDELRDEYKERQEIYFEEYKLYEKAKKKGEECKPPKAPEFNRVIITNATYEGLVKATKESGGRILLLLDELVSLFAMMNRTNTPGEAQKWLSGYNGESVTTVRSMTQEINVSDAYWAISGGSTPEKFREFISSSGRDKDGTLSRFIIVWAPEQTEYEESDINLDTLDDMKRVMERLVDFQPPQTGRRRCQVVGLDENTEKAWKAWKRAVFYAKQNSDTDMEVSFISKSQDLLPRIALILHCLYAAEESIAKENESNGRNVTTVDGVTYSDPVRPQMVIPSQIDIETWNAALEITQWLRQETMTCYRMLSLVCPQNVEEKISKLLSLIKDAGPDGVTARTIGQKIRAFRYESGKQLLIPILNQLINDGVIKKKLDKGANGSTVTFYTFNNHK